jgi:hypothetical protein
MSQNALSVITRIKPAERQALEDLLDVIGNDIDGEVGNHYIQFTDLTTIHFACWVVLRSAPDSDTPSRSYPDTLVLETNFDGDLDPHLDELIARGGAALDAIYRSCENWPAEGSANPALVKQYLKSHAAPTLAFYIGCPGQTLASIRNAIAVREELETFLDSEAKKQPWSALSPAQVRQKLLNYLQQGAQTKPVLSPETLDAQIRRSERNIALTALVILVALPIVILLLPLLLIWYIVLRMHETADASKPIPPPLPIDPRLFGKEDYFVQNHLTTLVEVKSGAFRLNTLKVILAVVNLVAKTIFITGQLGGIPTIHFARWILMDNDRRLLFFSNYDGSWASYLGDFVDKANYGLTAIWSNTDRFPPATNLAFGGAQHVEAFKQWSRQHNVYAAVWYSAYPDETLQNLKNDLQIRDRIASPNLSEADVAALLQLL